MKDKTLHGILLASFLLVLIWSVIHPKYYITWFLEVVPALIGVIVLAATYSRFKLTNLAYVLLWVSAVLMAVGGHYTYEKVPLFEWVRETFHFHRNHYDRFVHFVQAATAAVLAREILVRRSPLPPGKWLFFIVIAICLSLSALYELVEFAIALAAGRSAESFLGMQGDQWDSQWDMFFGLIGAAVSLLSLGKYQDGLIRTNSNE